MSASDDVPDPSGPPGTPRVVVELSVAAVAARVGVATSTLRAWDRRYGVGPSRRSTGGHRRYTNDDVAVLQRLHRLVRSGTPTAAAAALALTRAASNPGPLARARPADRRVSGINSLEQQFSAASEALDTRRMGRVATRALRELGAVDAWSKVFAPRLQALGERWAQTGLGVEREHITAAAVHTALTRHAQRLQPGRSATLVLVAAAPAERHTLPLDALAAALAEHGVATLLLGPAPPSAIFAAIADIAPAVAILWACSTDAADTVTLREAAMQAPVAGAAGPGWTPRRLPGGVIHLPDLPAAVASVLDLTGPRRSDD